MLEIGIPELAFIFAVGMGAGAVLMYRFRSYELSEVLRLKRQLDDERRHLWNEFDRAR